MTPIEADRAVHIRPRRAAKEANHPRTEPARAAALAEALNRAVRCRRCGAALEDPESRQAGLGPTCRVRG